MVAKPPVQMACSSDRVMSFRKGRIINGDSLCNGRNKIVCLCWVFCHFVSATSFLAVVWNKNEVGVVHTHAHTRMHTETDSHRQTYRGACKHRQIHARAKAHTQSETNRYRHTQHACARPHAHTHTNIYIVPFVQKGATTFFALIPLCTNVAISIYIECLFDSN